jgi:penicillin-binding protein 1A
VAKRRRSWWWRHRRPLFVLVLLLFSAGAGVAYAVARTPLPAEIPQAQTTMLTFADGRPLASLSNGENRVDVALTQVPQVVVDAVVATEDRGYFHHGGVDPFGIFRAVVADLSGHHLQGGSTITQQYVKNVFLSPRRTLSRKVREAVLAIKLERRYSKSQILERYLNTIYLGRGAYGVQAASRAYFGKDVSALGVNEAAFLAGIISSPGITDPYVNPRAANNGRNRALDSLVATRHLSSASAAADKAVPVTSFVRASAQQADPTITPDVPGVAYYVAYVTAQLVRRYGEATALGGGLRVRTTLDPAAQTAAYNAVYGVLTDPVNDPSGAIVALDPNGSVRAMVGGRDYRVSKVNLAVGADGGGTGRQAGSTFKPVLLAEVAKEGYSLLSQFPAPAEIIMPRANNGADYTVKNFDGESFPSTISLLDATKLSVNTVFAQAAASVGPSKIAQMGRQLGVTTPLPANVSLVLGTTEVSVLDMADVYATLMNRGEHVSPQVVEEVRDPRGAVLDHPTPQRTTVLSQQNADIVTYALQQVVLSGTGTGAQIGRPLAGKTGTTESYGDAWFIGYTPQLTAAVWMGYRDSKHPMLNVHGVAKVNGGSLPAEIFKRFMSAAMTGVPVLRFPTVTNLSGGPLTPPAVTLVTTSTTSTTSTTTTTSTTVPGHTSTSLPTSTSTSRPTATTTSTTRRGGAP